jgi:hypothetical protein
MNPFLKSKLRTIRRHNIIHVTILSALTQRNRILTEKIIAFKMTYKFPAFKGCKGSFLRSHNPASGPHPETVTSSPDQQTQSLKFILILSSHLYFYFSSSLCHQVFRINLFVHFNLPRACYMFYPSHPPLFFTLVIFIEDHKL